MSTEQMAEQIYIGLVVQLITVHGPQEVNADWYGQRTQAAFEAARVFTRLNQPEQSL
jgi:hypothetical protein